MPAKLVSPEQDQLLFAEYLEPTLGAGEVRVRCEHAAAKHGTELAFFKGYAQPRGKFDGEYLVHRADIGRPGAARSVQARQYGRRASSRSRSRGQRTACRPARVLLRPVPGDPRCGGVCLSSPARGHGLAGGRLPRPSDVRTERRA